MNVNPSGAVYRVLPVPMSGAKAPKRPRGLATHAAIIGKFVPLQPPISVPAVIRGGVIFYARRWGVTIAAATAIGPDRPGRLTTEAAVIVDFPLRIALRRGVLADHDAAQNRHCG
jgi:hypothetical protein